MTPPDWKFVNHAGARKTPYRGMARGVGTGGRTGFLLCGWLVLVAVVFTPSAARAAETQDPQTPTSSQPTDPVTAAFSGFDPDSDIELDHSMWSDLLSKTTVYAGRSAGRIGRGTKRVWIGSRMRFGNDLPSRYENNRVVLSKFTDAHLDVVQRYRRALESAPAQLPLSKLNRDQQLAYWLNLYNVHALEHVAAHYPEETTEALRSAPGEAPAGVWHERTLNVAGIPLSLVDIEQKILFPIWDDPLVLYGLWQGAIGGPRLPQRAYTGARVWRMLRENAVEFVNSNRGTDPDGDVLEASLLYAWGAPLFDGPAAVRRHILAYAQPPFSIGLDAAQRVEVDLYDWHLADLSGGTHHRGQWNNMAALAGASAGGSQFIDAMMLKDATHGSMPATTVELLEKMHEFNDRSRQTRVTIRDCPPGSDCAAVASDNDGGEAEQASGAQPDPDG